MQHPVQALATAGSVVVSAVDRTLSCFDLSTSTALSTSEPHSALIRLVATWTDPNTRASYVVSTGEDKQLVVSELPSLAVRSQRELVKRANALEITRDGEIVVGDKFGDVYTFPLDPPAVEPSPATVAEPSDKKKPSPEYLPILGHVSMLNAMALIPGTGKNAARQYIATGDRDEHVRVSRFPLGHVIEGFLSGSKHFVSSLLYVAPSPTVVVESTSSNVDRSPLVISAGGDATVQAFALDLAAPGEPASDAANPVGRLVARYEVESLLLPHVVVAPELPDPVPAGRKKDKKGKHKSTNLDGTPQAAAAAAADAGEQPAEEQLESVGRQDDQDDEADKKGLKTGLAVIKMVQVGTEREHGGVLILAAGCTALLYVPFSSLLSSSSSSPERSHTLFELPHPILDFVLLANAATVDPSAATSSERHVVEYLVSLDTTRSPSSSSSSTSPPLMRISLDPSTREFHLLPPLPRGLGLVESEATTTTEQQQQQQPSIASLYPVLMMLHHPGEESDLLVEGEGGVIGDGKPKGGVRINHHSNASGSTGSRGKKRTSSELDVVEGGGDRGEEGEQSTEDNNGGSGETTMTTGRNNNGKRAVGRAETQRRWEEAKKKLAQAEAEAAKAQATGQGSKQDEGERHAAALAVAGEEAQ